MSDIDHQILKAIKEQTDTLKKIERHLRPKVPDAAPIRRPNLQEPAGSPGESWSSVPPLPPGVEPMTENDDDGFRVIDVDEESAKSWTRRIRG